MKKLILTCLLFSISIPFFAQIPTTLTDITPNNCNSRTLRVSYNGGYSLYANGQWSEYRASSIEVRYYNNNNCNATSGGSGFPSITYNIPNWTTQGTGPKSWDFNANLNGFYQVEIFYKLNTAPFSIHSSMNASRCINNLTYSIVANGTINGGASVVCNSLPIILTNTSTGADANSYYKIDAISTDASCSFSQGSVNATSGWKQGNPSSFNVQTELSNTLFNNQVGYTKITLTYLNGCGASSKTFCIQKVNQIPAGVFQFSTCGGSGVSNPSTNMNSPTSVSANGGGSIINTSFSVGGITEYAYKVQLVWPGTTTLWQLASSGWIQGQPPVSITFNSIMNQWGQGTVNPYFNNSPAIANLTFKVTLDIKNPCGTSSIFGFFRPNNSACKTDELTTSIEDQESLNSLGLYPNPTKGNTTLAFESIANTPSTLSIFDISGKLVKDVFVNKELGAGIQTYDFDISLLPSGTYVYRLSTDKITKGTFIKN